MPEETTPVEQTTEEPAENPDELNELRHFQTMANAELEALRPAALRESIRAAGADPDSPTGKTIAELSKTIPSLVTAPRMVAEKIRELGLPFADQPATPPLPTGDPYLDDPRPRPDLPHWAPQNTPGDVAYKVASQQAVTRQHRQQLEIDRADERQRVEEVQRRNEERAKWGRQLAPPERQPTGGVPADKVALLNDSNRDYLDRITEARRNGWYDIASRLQTAYEREQAAKK